MLPNILVILLLPILTPGYQHGVPKSRQFFDLYMYVYEKMQSGSMNHGIGFFPDATKEFGPSNFIARRSKFNFNFYRLIHFHNKHFDLELNYFSLMDESEREMYISNTEIEPFDIFNIYMNQLPEPEYFPKSPPENFHKYQDWSVAPRHSGATNTGALQAGIMAVDYIYYKTTKTYETISAQYYLNCGKEDTPKWPHKAWQMAERYTILPIEDEVPWTGEKGQCQSVETNLLAQQKIKFSPSGVRIISCNALDSYEANYGPLVVCVYVDPKEIHFFFYKSGKYNLMSTDFTQCNHFVVMIGYAPDYIHIRNTWGLDWGDKGTMKIKRNMFSVFVTMYAVMEIKKKKVHKPTVRTLDFNILQEWKDPISFKDLKLSKEKLKKGDFFLFKTDNVTSHNTVVVRFMTLSGDIGFLNYILKLRYHKKRLYQSSRVPGIPSFRQRERLLPKMRDDKLIIRVTFKENLIQAFVNDEMIKPYVHQAVFTKINIVEAHNIELVQHIRPTPGVPVMMPNSGSSDEPCENWDSDEICNYRAGLGYCFEFTKYYEYMLKKCPVTCGVC